MNAHELVHGVTISFDSGFFGNITGVDPMNVTRETVNVSNVATSAWMAKIMAALADGGDVTIRGNAEIGMDPPITDAPSTCTITGRNGGVITGTAGMTGFRITGEHEEGKGLFTYEGTLVWTDQPTCTGAGTAA
ncbi:MAG: hypothetical protein KBA18_09500 [Kiritimatiellae bacterium]|nr:hypothetical protein [Kiritimatiellia bacterium]